MESQQEAMKTLSERRIDYEADILLDSARDRGEMHPSAKLTVVQVLEIRRRWPMESSRRLAAEFGVSHTAIRRAALGIKWRSLG